MERVSAQCFSISCRNQCNFGFFWPKFGCHGNRPCSPENSDSIFELANPKNPTIHARSVSIYCTEMKLCLFECFAYLYHCNSIGAMVRINSTSGLADIDISDFHQKQEIYTFCGTRICPMLLHSIHRYQNI